MRKFGDSMPIWLCRGTSVSEHKIMFDWSKSILDLLNAFGYKNTLDKIDSREVELIFMKVKIISFCVEGSSSFIEEKNRGLLSLMNKFGNRSWSCHDYIQS